MTNEMLIQEYKDKNDRDALNTLIENNEAMIIHCANKYKKFANLGNLDFDDLVQEGWIIFLKAVEKYIESENVKFSTYAYTALIYGLLRVINKNIPRKYKSNSDGEIIKVNSIDDLIKGSESTTLADMISDESAFESFQKVDNDLDNKKLRIDLLKMLDDVFGKEINFYGQENLTDFEMNAVRYKLKDGITAKEIILLHYGLYYEPMSFTKIGELVNLSAQRIQQIEEQGLYKIRTSKNSRWFIEKYIKIKRIDFQNELNNIDYFGSVEGIVSKKYYFNGLLNKMKSFDEINAEISLINEKICEIV